MADAYWGHGDGRQPPSSHSIPSSLPSIKRPRSHFDVPSGHEMHNYYPADDDRGSLHRIRDSESIGASYDRYLQNSQILSYGGAQSARPMGRGVSGHPVDDPRIVGMANTEPRASVRERTVGYGSRRPDVSLPPDATNTLYVEGLPSDCTRREVAHIFRPFVGYKEVRLVSKEPRHSGGVPLILCFVDFLSPAHAATAMDAIQGYKFDEHDRESIRLRLQFARYPGARSGGGYRGKR